MNYYDREEWPGFLASIRANPDDDLTRLVCADWLEENGEPERAELIRVQCNQRIGPYIYATGNRASVSLYRVGTVVSDVVLARAVEGVSYTVERGFISRVRAPLATLIGGECGRCGGGGRVTLHGNRISETSGNPFVVQCTTCHGTGRTPGVLRELLRREPLGPEDIEVSDREPWESAGEKGMPSWWRETAWRGRGGQDNAAGNLPDDVFDVVGEMCPDARMIWSGPLSNQHLSFPTESAARLALSRAVYAMCSG